MKRVINFVSLVVLAFMFAICANVFVFAGETESETEAVMQTEVETEIIGQTAPRAEVVEQTAFTLLDLNQRDLDNNYIQTIPKDITINVIGNIFEQEGVFRICTEYEGKMGSVAVSGLKLFTKDEKSTGLNWVEVNIQEQKVTLHLSNGRSISSDCVTGTEGVSDTPTGSYYIEYKQEKTTLRGEDYSSDVDYWMPFYGGYGLHDASWRYDFGGDIYKYSGSHGCVNLPHWMAETIYENISEGDLVRID